MEGTPFGRYQLIEVLGRGGMGEVWRAYDPTMNRVVALKVLPPNFAGDEIFQERFRREARAAAGLDEPHVVPVYDFGEVQGRLYVTMRLINGRDLQTLLDDGPLQPARAVSIIEQIALALDAAHRIGLVHRDVKPSNILVAERDFAYLIDFGIARTTEETGLTSTGATIGTWAYMAPERLNSGRAGARSDIYALACVLYEALTGQRPYPGDSLEQQIVGHLTNPPPQPSALKPDVPEPLDAVIACGMAKDPDQRYATTMELANAARAALTANASVDIASAAGLSTRRDIGTDDVAATVNDASASPSSQDGVTAAEAETSPTDRKSLGFTDHGAAASIGNAPTHRATVSDPNAYALAAKSEQESRPHGGNRRTMYLIGASAAIAVVVLTVAAIAAVGKSSRGGGLASPTSTIQPTSVTTSTSALGPTTTTLAGPAQKLMSLVPVDANCKPGDAAAGIAVAHCVGPSFARLTDYILYADRASMDRDFNRAATDLGGNASCPGMGRSPQQWHRAGNPSQIEGRIVCWVDRDGDARMFWTIDSEFLYGVMFGDFGGVTIDQLYSWWKAHYQ